MKDRELGRAMGEFSNFIAENKRAALGLVLSLGIFTYNPVLVGVGIAGLGLFVVDRGLNEVKKASKRSATLSSQRIK